MLLDSFTVLLKFNDVGPITVELVESEILELNNNINRITNK